MTCKKAKKEIKSLIKLARKHYPEVPDHIEALKMASEALKRQMPKKYYDDHVDGKCCPICSERATLQTWGYGYPVVIKMNYCQNCGQKLDWSEE